GEQVVLDEVHVGKTHEAHCHYLHLRTAGYHHRPEELVPAPHELDNQQRGNSRLDGRQNHREEDAKLAGAIDAGRVDVIVGDRLDRLPHQEYTEDADQVRGDDARVGVEQSEVVHPHVERHHDRLERNHHDAYDGKEENVPSGELILRETEPR